MLRNSSIREGVTDLRTDGRTDGPTDGRTDLRTDGRTYGRNDGQTGFKKCLPARYIDGADDQVCAQTQGGTEEADRHF